MRRGIRLGSDMVPNHTGLDSRWMIEHPDRFLQLPYPPFPTYSYGCANLSGLRSVSSYRLAGMICELENEEMNRIDAAIARQLDIMRYYNTLKSVIQDNKEHILRLNTVLERLCEMTGAKNNNDLITKVESLSTQK